MHLSFTAPGRLGIEMGALGTTVRGIEFELVAAWLTLQPELEPETTLADADEEA